MTDEFFNWDEEGKAGYRSNWAGWSNESSSGEPGKDDNTSISPLWLEAFEEVVAEEKALGAPVARLDYSPRPTYVRDSLPNVLREFGPMPHESLLLGVAMDHLPVLLNLHDPVPGPLLIAADAGSGKTDLLKNIAKAAGMMHGSQDLQYGVVTPHPEEWQDIDQSDNNVGIFPTFHQSSEDFILSLASWAHGNKTSGQSVVLLIDDLEAAGNMNFDAKQNLRWLLMRGPARRVWPIVTINPNRVENVLPWLDAFHTRILGPQSDKSARRFDAQSAGLNELQKGSEFAIREGQNWLKFWIPS
jgi:hypothetical protein